MGPISSPSITPHSCLAEVHVVHGGDRGQPRARRAGQGVEGDALDLVVTIGLEAVATNHTRAVVQDGFVVGDGRELDHRTSIIPRADGGRRRGGAAPTNVPTIATRRARRRTARAGGIAGCGPDELHRGDDGRQLLRRRLRPQRGTLPCFRFGSSSRLVRSMSRPLISMGRVMAGSITSSM